MKIEKFKIAELFYFRICILHFAFCVLISALSSCSLPRIIVLDDPLSPEEHVNLGVAYEKKGELDNALEEYRKASKKLTLAYLYMGNVYLQLNKQGDAEESYRKVIAKIPDDPGSADAYNNLAWLYYTKSENLGDAEVLARKALLLRPSDPNYLDTLNKIRELRTKNKL